MSTVIMDMGQYKIEAAESTTRGYADERMSPDGLAAPALMPCSSEGKRNQFPPQLAHVDMELFLQKISRRS